MQRTVDHGGVGVYSESNHDGELWALLLLSEFVSFTSFGLGERCVRLRRVAGEAPKPPVAVVFIGCGLQVRHKLSRK